MGQILVQGEPITHCPHDLNFVLEQLESNDSINPFVYHFNKIDPNLE